MNFPSHRFRKLDDHKTDPATLVKYDALAGQVWWADALPKIRKNNKKNNSRHTWP